MENVFNICILIGVLIPSIALIVDFLGDVVEFMNMDFGYHIDIGNVEISIIPTSGMSVCAGLLLFGTTGKLLGDRLNGTSLVLIAIAMGYVAAFIIQNIITYLKRVDNEAKSTDDMKSLIGKVIVTIPEQGIGVISVISNGSSVNYSAKSYDGHTIKQEDRVIVIRFENNIAIVEQCNHELKKYINQ